MRIPVLLSLGLMLAACTDEEKKPDPVQKAPLDFGYLQDDVLRINHLQVLGTHNSYHLEPEDPVDEWRYSHVSLTKQLEEQGVRQIELDVHYRSTENRFAVFHLPGADDRSTCPWFTDCLAEVKAWSDKNPGHHPLFVYLEPKDELERQADKIQGHYDDLDAEILSVFPSDRLITPDDVRGDYETVSAAIKERGWPTLGEARGKLIFVFLDTDQSETGHHFGYTRGNLHLEGRVQFIDADITAPYAAFLAPGRTNLDAIRAGAKQGFISRILDDANNTPTGVTWSTETRAAIDAGVHIISTDHPTADSNPQGYFVDLAGGTPSRCNPVSAPAGCKSEEIESPDRLVTK